jgi:hypothetical protein
MVAENLVVEENQEVDMEGSGEFAILTDRINDTIMFFDFIISNTKLRKDILQQIIHRIIPSNTFQVEYHMAE